MSTHREQGPGLSHCRVFSMLAFPVESGLSGRTIHRIKTVKGIVAVVRPCRD